MGDDNLTLKVSVNQAKMKIFYKPFEIRDATMKDSKEGTPMKKETRTVVYDDELRIEAYRF